MKASYRLLTTAMACLLVAALASVADAEERKKITLISVKGMHCESCAAKLAASLKKVKGVADSKASAAKGIAMVVPANAEKLPSPRAQWEVIEKAGYQPVKLVGPYGVFTSKPRF